MTDPPTPDPRLRRAFARGGWASAAAAVLAVVAAVVERGDGAVAAVFALVALGCFATAVFFVGAPLSRTGRPSLLRIAALLALGVAGVVLTVLVGMVVALGVLQTSYINVRLVMWRWPPKEWAPHALERALAGQVPLGSMVGGVVLLPGWAALIAVVAVLTDSRAALAAGVLVAMLALAGCFAWIAMTYAGRA